VPDHAAGSDRPLPTGTVRLSPAVAAKRAVEQTQRTWWTFGVFVASIWAPLVAVAWHTPPWTWVSLAISMLLVPWFGRQMCLIGWHQRDLDEQVRTMGDWRVSGFTPGTRERVTLTGHMVYDTHEAVGALNRMVHVDLDAFDD
jgi:hypothetical protein